MKAKNLLLLGASVCAALVMPVLSETTSNLPSRDILRASNWSDFVEGEHAYGSSYQIPTMSYTLDGTSYPATVITTFPDGSQSAETKILLSQAGVHTLEYSVNVNGEIHNITKKIQVGFPQMYVGDMEKSSLKYVSKEESKALGAQGTAGIQVKLGFGDTLQFTKPIYLNEMNDVTALLRGYITPLNKGSADFGQLFIKFTDADDPNKFFIICYYSHIETGSDGVTSHSSSVLARSDAQPYFAGWHQTQGLHTNDTWGLWSAVAFDGYYKDKRDYADYVDEAKFVVGFDYASKTVYGTGFGKGATLETVLDLDDTPAQVATPWGGFTSNRAFMSVYADSYSGSTANFVITDVAGVSAKELMENSFTDNEDPEITIESEYETLPNGVINHYYPIPKAKAYDQVSKECPVTSEVFYNYFSNDRTNVKIENGKFYMDKQGTYTICYTATDKAGNKAQKLYTISAFDALSMPDFTLSPSKTSAYVGEYIEVHHDIIAKDGVGKKNVDVYYEVDNERHLVKDDGFRIEELKDYKVIYVVTDMIGQKTEKSYTISVSDGHRPILGKKICYARYFISGGYYEFPKEKVYFYEDGKLKEEPLTVEVTDANGAKNYQNEELCPVIRNNGDKVTLKAKFGDTILQEDAITTIKNIGTEQSARSLNLANYFVSDGLKKELTTEDGMALTVLDANKAAFDFATPLYADSFQLELKSLMNFKDRGGIVLRLSDAEDEENVIEARIYLDDEKTYFAVGDEKALLINNDINVGDNDYSIAYKEGVFSCGANEIAVKKTTKGKDFEGFKSLKAYFSLAFENVLEGATLNVTSYCQSGFSSKTARDRVSPVVQMDNNYGGTKTIGSIYHIDPAYSFDVLSPNVTFTLNALAPSGDYLKATDGTLLKNADPTRGYDVVIEEYGQYYFTLNTIEDSRFLANGTELTIGYSIQVYDDIAPTIAFKNGMKKEAKVGETVLLPAFDVSDNITSKENIIVQRVMLSPSGVYRLLDDSYNAYTFKEEGTYTLTIHVADEAGNFVTKSFVTKVTKA